jgi:hypothetical protein
MQYRFISIGSAAGALAAASLPLAVAIVSAISPELALLASGGFALLGSGAGAEVGARAAAA